LERAQQSDLQNKTRKPQHIIEQILRQLKDRVRSLLRTLPKDTPLPQEASIILHLGLHSINPQGIIKGVSQINIDVKIWQPLPYGFLKVNIDGASKGNPGLAGFGGAIRDDQGQIKKIFHGHLGEATNNMEELMALEQCLEILVDSNSQNVIIEADSELIIRVAKKICDGTSLGKVSKHWKLLQVFHCIYSDLQTLKIVRFVHVKKKANMLANGLVNEGVTKRDRDS